MKLADISSGPDWIIWVGFVIFLVISIILLSGHGSWFISGYNTATKKEKASLFEDVLPAGFAYISLGVVIVDCMVIILVSHTICKK